MTALYPLLADQLTFDMASLQGFNPKVDILVFCEVRAETDYVEHHPQKIAFLFSAMRHFAKTCENMNFKVHYVRLDDPDNTQSLMGEWERLAKFYSCQDININLPGEWRLTHAFEKWQKQSHLDIKLFEDKRFLCSHEEFASWASGKKQLRMEYFYQMMRKKYQILLDEKGQPEGGRWNYDSENREPFKPGINWSKRLDFTLDDITFAVLELVKKHFSHHFGGLDDFNYACTTHEAQLALDDFIEHHLPHFGQYQDVMVTEEAFLHHSLISMYLHVGFLDALSLCRRVENLYRQGKVPLSSAEGFIRQILGWREYVRGIYWLKMPEYANQNFLNASEPLPKLYWGGRTKMNCMQQVVQMTEKYAYSHHIQRLMITGNFALLAGLEPKAVTDWYLAVYIDAFEWVELPNTLGMALYGDGGILASKPYAASARYIEKMSNFCKSCHFKSKEMLGERACPFNALYWNFIAKHEAILKTNPRMAYMYATWTRFPEEKRKAILEQAKDYLLRLKENNL
jgi:deoxyribodipyrimidine photolyase-related protein